MITLMNAAGWVKLPHDVEPLLAVPSDVLSAITLGSYTLEQRDGNSGSVYWDNGLTNPTSINALGLPNPGMDAAQKFLPDLISKIRTSGKRSRISIAGFGVTDYAELLKMCWRLNPNEIEVNLGCPNVRVDGEQKPIFAFNIEDLGSILKIAHSIITDSFQDPSISFKLSPYSDPFFLAEVAEVIKAHAHKYTKLVLCNTFPNAYGFTEEFERVVYPNEGFGGLAGHAMKHIALGQLRQFRRLLPEVELIGAGGISSGRDLSEMELVGAREAQVGTAFFSRGPRVFQEIATEYTDLVD